MRWGKLIELLFSHALIKGLLRGIFKGGSQATLLLLLLAVVTVATLDPHFG